MNVLDLLVMINDFEIFVQADKRHWDSVVEVLSAWRPLGSQTRVLGGRQFIL